MRILILTTFFPPLNSVSSLRPHSWAKQWTSSGHEVTVVTPERLVDPATSWQTRSNGYKVVAVPEWSWCQRLRQGYNLNPANQKERRSRPSGDRLKNLIEKLRSQTGVLGACRMPDISDLWIGTAKRALERLPGNWDLVVSSYGPYAPHVLANHLKKQGRAKRWIADFRDLWVDHHFYRGLFPFRMLEARLERKYIERADLITVVTDGMRKLLMRKYPEADIKVIHNGYDASEWTNLEQSRYYPNDGRLRLAYTGSLHEGTRNPTPLFEVLSEWQYPEELKTLEIVFAGPGLGRLTKLVDKYRLGTLVKNAGMVTREDALRMQRDADALLFLEWGHPSASYVLTGKLFEYLHSGRPILGIGPMEDSEAGKLLVSTGAGCAVGNNKAAIRTFVQQLLQGSLQERYSTKCEMLQTFDRKHLADKLLDYATHLQGLTTG